jgi:predicted RNase H-like HicB family nuclease
MSEIIFVVETPDEGGYTAKALGYSIFTEGETLEELKENIKDAVRCHFDDKDRPRIARLHMVKDEVMAL